MLTKNKHIDQITVTENGIILVREVTIIAENDIELSKSFHRSSLTPGQNLTGQPESVVAVATAAWTSEIIIAFAQGQAMTNAASL